jgi:menaquinone-dependent protoporphyrinogen oxidase
MNSPKYKNTEKRALKLNTLNRRNFLKAAGGFFALTLSCGGLTWAASLPPKIDLSDQTFAGEQPMNSKILVTYATRAGSTAEVAAAIGEEIAASDAAVDVKPLKNVTDISAYRAVIIGSCIRYSQWMPEAVKFVEQHQSALNQIPTAFFAMHLMNMGDDEASRKARLSYLDGARKFVKPKAEAFFAGNGDMSRVSFLERMIGKAVKSPEGDLRDWSSIRAWAKDLQL